MKSIEKDRVSERGAAGIKFVLVLLVLFLAGNAGYNYVPVAYDAETMKSEMSAAVMQGIALPGKMGPVDNVKARIQRAVQANNIPQDAIIDVKQQGNMLSAHVAYSKQVNILPFGIYKYNYEFDHTATPSGFLLKQN